MGIVSDMQFQFCEYKGVFVKKWGKVYKRVYFQLFTNDEETHFVDAQCMNSSTWLRFVNTARNYSEQNVVAYQDEGQIYYMSFRQIPKNTELLVWYGSSDYDELLGIDTDKYKAEVKCPDSKCVLANRRVTADKHHSLYVSENRLGF